MKIKLTKPEMATFSSHMGTVKFENGVSVNEVTEVEARRLAAITSVEVYDENDEVVEVGYASRMAVSRNTPAPDATMRETLADKQGGEEFKSEETPPNVEVHLQPEKKPGELEQIEGEINEIVAEGEDVVIDAATAEVHSLESLEAIADKDGIKGLRAIGDKVGVKNNSIAGLIQEILAAQET